tara:strand:- start:2649 stop:3179 length:531 start_codon:yes stop_codon:yes gene_type:complete
MFKKIELGALYASGVCIVALLIMITITVLSRNIFGWGVPDDVIIVGELMVGAVFLPLGYVTADYSHVTIEFLFNRMRKPLKLWVLAMGSLISLLIMLPLVFAAWNEFFHTAKVGAYFFGELELPEWPGRFAFFAGAALFIVRLTLICIADIRAAIGGDTKYLVQRTNAEQDSIEEG